jgi:hypothetical protein
MTSYFFVLDKRFIFVATDKSSSTSTRYSGVHGTPNQYMSKPLPSCYTWDKNVWPEGIATDNSYRYKDPKVPYAQESASLYEAL